MSVAVSCIIVCSAHCLTSPQDGGTRGSVTRGEQLASRLQSGPDQLPEAPGGSAGGSTKTSSLLSTPGVRQELRGGTLLAPPCGQHHTLRPPLDLAQSPDGEVSHREMQLRGRETVKVKVYFLCSSEINKCKFANHGTNKGLSHLILNRSVNDPKTVHCVVGGGSLSLILYLQILLKHLEGAC